MSGPQVVYDTLKINDHHYREYGYLQSWYYLGWLIVVAGAAHNFIQKPSYRWCIKLAQEHLKKLMAFLDSSSSTRGSAHRYMGFRSSRTAAFLAVATFLGVYVCYVNISCVQYNTTPLDSRRWLTSQDFRWLIAQWTIPCATGRPIISPIILLLGMLASLVSVVALPALMVGYIRFASSCCISDIASGIHERPPSPDVDGDGEEEGVKTRPSRVFIRMYMAEDYPRHLVMESATRALEALREAATAGVVPPEPVLEAVGMDSLTGAEVMKLAKVSLPSSPPSQLSPSSPFEDCSTKVSLCCMYDVKDQSMEGLVGLARRKTGSQPHDIIVQMDGSSR